MDELRFDGQVAVVTGAGRGLGREHALLLAKRGASVVVNDLPAPGRANPAQAVVEEIIAAGGRAVTDGHSVSTIGGGAALIQTALESFGGVDIVVNNAGIVRDKAFHKLTPDMLDSVLDVHLRGGFYVTQPAWRIMREQGYGRIVFTSSSSGILGNFGQSNYGAAKMGLVGLTRVLAAEGERYGIRVNAIAPSARTPMTDEVLGDTPGDLDPRYVAPVVAWLSHRSVPVNGEVFTAGAGRVARFFIGMTQGHINPALTVEDVAAHVDTIRDETNYTVPAGPADELEHIVAAAKLAAEYAGSRDA
ncbi:short-chain dehydrogenase [Mycolicibacterium setense]|uniref:SDR family NAD(P)-dependent oxidoreductase n=1 Tax=Mycolicibacterium setense TaxID=431269 RepID=UPI0007E93A39|nr:SDR family NAD(P)-dependent oxidoreductase [Mycolicibacterium setense]OBB14636.1 short-chain dehydrogenase [Mycolicibacterium setense]